MERFWPSNDTEMTDPPSDVWMGRQDWPLRAWTKAVAERRDVVVIVVIAMVLGDSMVVVVGLDRLCVLKKVSIVMLLLVGEQLQ
jgi:hypothetical protein